MPPSEEDYHTASVKISQDRIIGSPVVIFMGSSITVPKLACLPMASFN